MQAKLFDSKSLTAIGAKHITKNAADQENKNILSIFDLTGAWSGPYKDNGYNVMQIDIQLGIDLMKWNYRRYSRNYFAGILIAQPCTDFALSGAKHFAEKDENGCTYESMSLTYKALAIVQYFNPGLRFWSLENPMSRIHILCPDLGKIKYKFHPFQYAGYLKHPKAEQYKKSTWLWGNFNIPPKKE